MRKRILPHLILGLVFCASLTGLAANPAPTEDGKALRRELEALKASQDAIGKDVAELPNPKQPDGVV